MLELRLRHQGNGTFQTAYKLDHDRARQEFEPGAMVRAKVSRPRSVTQNNTFHSAIQIAWLNKSGPGPDLPSWEALKDWLLIQVGWCNERRVAVGKLTTAEARVAGIAIAASLRTENDFVAVAYDVNRHEFVMRTAKSVRFEKADHYQMTDLMRDVLELICSEIMPGATPDALVEEVRRKAAGDPGSPGSQSGAGARSKAA